jgi:hypothetical protein
VKTKKLLVLVAVLANAYGYSASAQGTRTSLEGDAYLATANGDVKRIAANRVFLLPAGDSLQGWNLACEAIFAKERAAAMVELAAMGERNDLARDPAYAREATAKLKSFETFLAARRFAPTNVVGHFRFLGLKPGVYFLTGSVNLTGQEYIWWKRIFAVEPALSSSVTALNSSGAAQR